MKSKPVIEVTSDTPSSSVGATLTTTPSLSPLTSTVPLPVTFNVSVTITAPLVNDKSAVSITRAELLAVKPFPSML